MEKIMKVLAVLACAVVWPVLRVGCGSSVTPFFEMAESIVVFVVGASRILLTKPAAAAPLQPAVDWDAVAAMEAEIFGATQANQGSPYEAGLVVAEVMEWLYGGEEWPEAAHTGSAASLREFRHARWLLRTLGTMDGGGGQTCREAAQLMAYLQSKQCGYADQSVILRLYSTAYTGANKGRRSFADVFDA
jgi:hypothetical protein